MKNILSSVANFIREEEGASAVEYGILVAAIAAAVVIIVIAVGQEVHNAFTSVCTSLKESGGMGSGVVCTG